jgi:hypothetical protein
MTKQECEHPVFCLELILYWCDPEGSVAQFKKQLHEGNKISKEKISGSGATVKGKWPYYIMNFLGLVFAASNYEWQYSGDISYYWGFIH